MAAKSHGREESQRCDELAAWTGLQLTHHLLVRRLGADLTKNHGMALVEFDVLSNLDRAGGSTRMSGLAEAAGLSRSGLTRVVDVLEAQRFVRRVPDSADGRATLAVITEAGRTRLDAAKVTQRAAIRQAFLAPLSDKQVKSLVKIWSAFTASAAPAPSHPGPPAPLAPADIPHAPADMPPR